MMKNRPRRKVRRINTKSGGRAVSPQTVLIISILAWVFVMADIYWANGPGKMTYFMMFLFTLGIFGFTYFYARPGKYGVTLWENGFWRTLFHRKRGRNERKQQRRRKQMQRYRR